MSMTDYHPYIEIAQSFSNMSYQGVFLIDFNAKKCIYSSEHPLLRCEMTEEEFANHGIDLAMSLIPQKELELIFDMIDSIKRVYPTIPLNLRKNIVISINANQQHNKRLVAVNYKLSSLCFDQSGHPNLLLGLVSPSIYRNEDVIIAKVTGTNLLFHFDTCTHQWEPVNYIGLNPTDEETTMLRLSMQGLTIKTISELMCKSPDTIRYYRRQVFSKLNATNINQAIATAVHYGII